MRLLNALTYLFTGTIPVSTTAKEETTTIHIVPKSTFVLQDIKPVSIVTQNRPHRNAGKPCRNCGKPLGKGRRAFCSDECSSHLPPTKKNPRIQHTDTKPDSTHLLHKKFSTPTLEQESLVCKLYKNGCSGMDIQGLTGISESTVYRILKRHSINRTER